MFKERWHLDQTGRCPLDAIAFFLLFTLESPNRERSDDVMTAVLTQRLLFIQARVPLLRTELGQKVMHSVAFEELSNVPFQTQRGALEYREGPDDVFREWVPPSGTQIFAGDTRRWGYYVILGKQSQSCLSHSTWLEVTTSPEMEGNLKKNLFKHFETLFGHVSSFALVHSISNWKCTTHPLAKELTGAQLQGRTEHNLWSLKMMTTKMHLSRDPTDTEAHPQTC